MVDVDAWIRMSAGDRNTWYVLFGSVRFNEVMEALNAAGLRESIYVKDVGRAAAVLRLNGFSVEVE